MCLAFLPCYNGGRKGVCFIDFDIGDIYDAIFSSQQRAAGLADASSGHDRLVEEQLNDLTENSEYLKELVELRRIADAAETRAKLAIQKAEDAEKQSKSSNRIAAFSLVISFVSAVAAVASAVIAYMALTPAG